MERNGSRPSSHSTLDVGCVGTTPTTFVRPRLCWLFPLGYVAHWTHATTWESWMVPSDGVPKPSKGRAKAMGSFASDMWRDVDHGSKKARFGSLLSVEQNRVPTPSRTGRLPGLRRTGDRGGSVRIPMDPPLLPRSLKGGLKGTERVDPLPPFPFGGVGLGGSQSSPNVGVDVPFALEARRASSSPLSRRSKRRRRRDETGRWKTSWNK